MSPSYDIKNVTHFILRNSIACHIVLESPFQSLRMKHEIVVDLLPFKAVVLTLSSSFC